MKEKDQMEQGETLFVISVTTLDTLWGIVEHQSIRMDIIKGAHMYVSYEINMVMLQEFVE